MEMIAAAAVKINQKLYVGTTHKEALDQFGRHVPLDMEDGYVTTKGRFVDRMEGYRIARRAGQLTEQAADRKRNLSIFGMADIPLNSSMVVAWGTHTFAGVVQ
jgi:hypothetical protein